MSGLAAGLENEPEPDDGTSSVVLAVAEEPAPAQPVLSLPPPPPPPHVAIYAAPINAAGSTPSFASTGSAEDRYIHNPASIRTSRSNSGNSLDGKKAKPTILEGDEQGIARADSRYSRLNRPLLLCAIAVALSSINYGWVIGSVNIPALVIEECSDGPET
ncbi:hypothetical protein GGF42_008972, partial [Coemansia sp. RSA 2424]